jgi:16S rRNA (guanine527-N7)-methyltransferase
VNHGSRLSAEGWAARLREAGVDAPLASPLGVFLEVLDRWGSAVDLVGAASQDEVVHTHVLESLAALPWIAPSGTLLDIGSGNGFPGVPLLLGRPAVRGVLLEPRERRWAFLREVVRELGLDAEVRRERVDEHRGADYSDVTIRGVALEAWFPHASRMIATGGSLLWWTGEVNAAELARKVPGEPVLPFMLPGPGRGCLAVWRPRST